ncbi:MAG: ABATE domain-containing protein [Sphaerobacter sp.]|nr:ABATE domain-containing protein [Sphaerobacter sp.]
MQPASQASSTGFKRVGGAVCLDFANTRANRDTEAPKEYLHSYADLVAWAGAVGVLSASACQALLAAARARPSEADETLAAARKLREAIYGIFSRIATGEPAPTPDLETLNAALARAMSRARVAPQPGGGFGWAWAAEPDALDPMLWAVARSAAELLTSPLLDRVRECAGHPCGWLFLDMSRNRSRRWCDMRDCGNRAKARRHYQRVRAARAAPR